jgi:GntR family transcriptional regulator/MocR family aminotransferase
MFQLRTDNVQHVPVDEEGICVDQLSESELVFVTPSHQYPTNATMSPARRQQILDWANKNDSLIIEDDYEYETNFRSDPVPALKSLDRSGRVLYIGSLSKSLMPGLRVGFIVAPAELVQELRAMRRLMLRHPPGNNQRVVALFLSLGIHNTLINKLSQTYQRRSETLSLALANRFHGWYDVPDFGGSSFWVRGPDELDVGELAVRAQEKGVLIEPGDVFFSKPEENRNYFRLGFSSISEANIEPGIELLAQCASEILD